MKFSVTCDLCHNLNKNKQNAEPHMLSALTGLSKYNFSLETEDLNVESLSVFIITQPTDVSVYFKTF